MDQVINKFENSMAFKTKILMNQTSKEKEEEEG